MATCILFLLGLLLMLTIAFIMSLQGKLWLRLIEKQTTPYWYLAVAASIVLLFVIPDMPQLHHLQKLAIIGGYAFVCIALCAATTNISYIKGGYHKAFTGLSLIAGVLHTYVLLAGVLFFGFGIE